MEPTAGPDESAPARHENLDFRGLLVKGEHPEYHEALADPLFEGELDGHSPRLHLTMHEVIANQLWDDDPPEVWQAPSGSASMA